MSAQHYNDVRTIARTAQQLGATLPKEITTALEHLEAINTGRTPVPQPGRVARELAQHLGNPAAMEKACKAAALEIATAEVRAKLDHHLAETCGSSLRGKMRANSEEIAAAFGDALADDLATLQNEAGKLPVFFRPEQADTLNEQTFGAWTRTRDAHNRITAAQPALQILYSGAVTDTTQFNALGAASLRYAKPPRFTNPTEAFAFRDALGGRAVKGMGLSTQGSARIDGLFVPTLLAHNGATFEWATPSQVTQRAALVVASMVERQPVNA